MNLWKHFLLWKKNRQLQALKNAGLIVNWKWDEDGTLLVMPYRAADFIKFEFCITGAMKEIV